MTSHTHTLICFDSHTWACVYCWMLFEGTSVSVKDNSPAAGNQQSQWALQSLEDGVGYQLEELPCVWEVTGLKSFKAIPHLTKNGSHLVNSRTFTPLHDHFSTTKTIRVAAFRHMLNFYLHSNKSKKVFLVKAIKTNTRNAFLSFIYLSSKFRSISLKLCA